MSDSCDPMDCSLPESSVHGNLQTRILEWVAMPSSRESSQPRDWTQVSHTAGRFVTILATREAQSPHKLSHLCAYVCVAISYGYLSKDPDAGKDWKQERGMTEDEMVGWHHWLNGHELSKLRESVMDREGLCAVVHGITELDITGWWNWTDWGM